MKRIVFIILVLFISLLANAQLEVKQGSFKEVVGFVNINREIQEDDNNVPYAIIKVKTENIDDKQRRELLFQGDAATFVECEYKTGEVWVYLTYKATYLKISHPDLSSTEFHFPFDMNPKCGYELTLVNTATNIVDGWGMLTISTNPEVGANVYLNGRLLPKTTPYYNDMMPVGKYEISLSKDKFQTITKTIEIKKEGHTHVEITMQCVYGEIFVSSKPSGANVYIDNERYGITPLEIKEKIVVGNHELRLEREGCATIIKTFTLEENKKMIIDEQLQTGKEITISTDCIGDKIFIDGNYVGTSPLKVELTFGDHEIIAVRGYDKTVSKIYSVPQDIERVKKTISVSWIDVQIQFGGGTLKGVYSVSANKKVRFSQGNLQYQALTNTWRFADNQIDIIGEANTNISSKYDGWIDLFGWGTGNNPTKTSAQGSDYNVYSEWGDNLIVNGKNKVWWTLSKEEWQYVLFSRKTTSGVRFAKAVVDGVNGIILLPDDWSIGKYSFQSVNKSDASFSNNRIAITDWTNKLEANGAVFLPAAGYRSTYPPRSYNNTGSAYWSSTSMCAVRFYDEKAWIDDKYWSKSTGSCVRLVCDAE